MKDYIFHVVFIPYILLYSPLNKTQVFTQGMEESIGDFRY